MRRRTIAILFVCATTVLTACSGSGSGTAAKDSAAPRTPAAVSPAAAAPKGSDADPTGGQILTDSLKVTRQATSLHLKADIADPKEGATKMDLSLNSKGDCTGTIAQGKDTIGIIKIGKTVYLRPQGTGKWTKTNTASADGKDLASVCDLNNFLGGFQGEDTAAEKGATTKVDGHPAIVLTEKDGDESYTMDVATSGKPYLLKMVTVGGDSPGTLAFSHFGEPVHAVAPTRSSIAA
ncbi:hypothetical protein [Streptomyces sp. WM6378]|uniref:hypothetical protein n=1 Tax=Streptomyces sp. WM6378 TaxID=1415557 RepID=UPI0006AEBF9E|nr:hypothetical protein [Streptomyces sp. WM6378]